MLLIISLKTIILRLSRKIKKKTVIIYCIVKQLSLIIYIENPDDFLSLTVTNFMY